MPRLFETLCIRFIFSGLLGFIVLVGSLADAYATPQTAPVLKQLATLEASLLGMRYPREPAEARLARLERLIYGKAKPAPGVLEFELRVRNLGELLASQRLSPPSAAYLEQLDRSVPASGEVIRFDGRVPNNPVFKVDENKLAAIEARLLKSDDGLPALYGEPSAEARITRLERRLFGSPAPASIPLAQRWARVQAVLQANPEGEGGLDDLQRNGLLQNIIPTLVGGLMILI